MQKKLVVLIGVFATLVAVGFITYQSQTQQQKSSEVHYHAGFKVFINGELQDYSDLRYMSITPCGEEEHEHSDKLDFVHLHDNVGDVVHVHAEGITWGDLFESIDVSFEGKSPVYAISDNKKIENILDKAIKRYESIIIVVDESERGVDYSEHSVSREHIIEAEGKSELCGS